MLEQKINEDKCTLFINNKKIIIDYMISPDYNLYLHKNFIELWFFDPVGSKNNLYIYDYQGNLLGSDKSLNIVNQDYINLTKEEYYHYYYISDFKITDNKIEYSIGYFNDSCYIQGTDESPDNCNMSKFNCSDLKDLGENINYISTYEIELIDNKFSTPKLISSTKLKDTDVYKKSINSCE